MAFFYHVTTSDSGVTENHTVRIYTSKPATPTSSGALDSANFLLDKADSRGVNANKVTTIVSGPTPTILGGIVTIEVTGDTGTIGNSKEVLFTPAIRSDWPADVSQVIGSQTVLTGGNNQTLTDDLYEVLGVWNPQRLPWRVSGSTMNSPRAAASMAGCRARLTGMQATMPITW